MKKVPEVIGDSDLSISEKRFIYSFNNDIVIYNFK